MWAAGDMIKFSRAPPPPTGDKACSSTIADVDGSTTISIASTASSCNTLASPDLVPEPPRSTKRVGKQFARTQLCKHMLRGFCRYKDTCAYAHSQDEIIAKPNLLKTKVCINFLSGVCRSSQCAFAHGIGELREVDPAASGNTFRSNSCESTSSFVAPSTHAATFRASHEKLGTSSICGYNSTSAATPLHDVVPARTAEQWESDLAASQFSQPPSRPIVAPNVQRANFSGMTVGVAKPGRGGERRTQDAILLKEVLSEIEHLLSDSSPHGDTYHGVIAPARDSMFNHWATLTNNALAWRRRKCQIEGTCLLQYSKRSEDLSRVEIQMLMLMLFRDRHWASVFPGLMRRCRSMLDSQLAAGLDTYAAGQLKRSGLNSKADSIHGGNQRDTRSADVPDTPHEHLMDAALLLQNTVRQSHQHRMRPRQDDAVLNLVPPANSMPTNLITTQQRQLHSQKQRFQQEQPQPTQQLSAFKQSSQGAEESLFVVPSAVQFNDIVLRGTELEQPQAALSVRNLHHMQQHSAALPSETMITMSL